MRRTEFLVDQLNRSFSGDPWHGPALRRLLDGVTEHRAREHPIAQRHSILELVVHITAWTDVVARRVSGTAVDSATVSDWADVSKISWAQAVEGLERAEARLTEAVGRLSDDDLGKSVPSSRRSIESEILGVLQHNVYHAGQIGLLKNAA